MSNSNKQSKDCAIIKELDLIKSSIYLTTVNAIIS